MKEELKLELFGYSYTNSLVNLLCSVQDTEPEDIIEMVTQSVINDNPNETDIQVLYGKSVEYIFNILGYIKVG